MRIGDHLSDGSYEYLDPEYDLLGEEPTLGDGADVAGDHALRTAPLFTGDAFDELTHRIFPQRALYGRVLSQHIFDTSERVRSPKVYVNTNTPFSALVCGVQGSGKSHSTSVLLESCLMTDGRIGTLPAPLSTLVFHFDTAAGGGLIQPCEAAYLSAIDPGRGEDAVPPPVTVLVVPTYLKAMKRVYAGLPRVHVEPLLFSPDDISGERLLAMMKVDDNTQIPLYMESIMAILRSMEDNFDYAAFRQQLSDQKFNPSQKAMLNIRLALLDSCLNGGTSSNSVKTHFKPGQLTIIDLSSPFMDGASACGFFDMILGLFVEAEAGASGKLVVLDEAHKYLSESQTGSSARLTESLLTVIRQQRHLATRVIVSTQEPTVVPSKFLDLCSIIIAHRFTSPQWLKTLAQHVSAADHSLDELFEKIVSLQTGQAVVFAPNGLCLRSIPVAVSASSKAGAGAEPLPHRTERSVGMLGQGYLIVRSRLRLTLDGGHSLLAVNTPGMTTRLGRINGRNGTEVLSARPVSCAVDGINGDGNSASDRSTSSTPPTSITPVSALSKNSIRRDQEDKETPGAAILSPIRNDSHQTSSVDDAEKRTISLPPSDVASSGPIPSPVTPSVQLSEEANDARVIDLTGDKEYFEPLVKCMQEQLDQKCATFTAQTLRRYFLKNNCDRYGVDTDLLDDMIQDAINLGVVAVASTNPTQIILVTGATYRFRQLRSDSTLNTSTSFQQTASGGVIRMDGGARRYAPLVKFVRKLTTTHWVNTTTIRKHFRTNEPRSYGADDASINAAVAAAVQMSLLEAVSDKAVRPVPRAVYIF